jgi:hypothetical protein
MHKFASASIVLGMGAAGFGWRTFFDVRAVYARSQDSFHTAGLPAASRALRSLFSRPVRVLWTTQSPLLSFSREADYELARWSNQESGLLRIGGVADLPVLTYADYDRFGNSDRIHIVLDAASLGSSGCTLEALSARGFSKDWATALSNAGRIVAGAKATVGSLSVTIQPTERLGFEIVVRNN